MKSTQHRLVVVVAVEDDTQPQMMVSLDLCLLFAGIEDEDAERVLLWWRATCVGV